jgi:secondary thiamine-phosphate synthase enzyme
MEAVHTEPYPLILWSETLRLKTEAPTQFIDITAWVDRVVRQRGVDCGVAQIQALHTTAAIAVNENEPLLLGDFAAMLERLAPSDALYAHDDTERRRANLLPDERPNGRAHARALLLGPSKLVTIRDGRPELGRWQSIFLVELDGPRERSVSIIVMGFRRDRA